MTISHKNKRNTFCILINGLPHLEFKKSELVGYQSYKEPTVSAERERGFAAFKFTIVFYMRTTSITCEYDKSEKWEGVLKILLEKIA